MLKVGDEIIVISNIQYTSYGEWVKKHAKAYFNKFIDDKICNNRTRGKILVIARHITQNDVLALIEVKNNVYLFSLKSLKLFKQFRSEDLIL